MASPSTKEILDALGVTEEEFLAAPLPSEEEAPLDPAEMVDPEVVLAPEDNAREPLGRVSKKYAGTILEEGNAELARLRGSKVDHYLTQGLTEEQAYDLAHEETLSLQARGHAEDTEGVEDALRARRLPATTPGRAFNRAVNRVLPVDGEQGPEEWGKLAEEASQMTWGARAAEIGKALDGVPLSKEEAQDAGVDLPLIQELKNTAVAQFGAVAYTAGTFGIAPTLGSVTGLVPGWGEVYDQSASAVEGAQKYAESKDVQKAVSAEGLMGLAARGAINTPLADAVPYIVDAAVDFHDMATGADTAGRLRSETGGSVGDMYREFLSMARVGDKFDPAAKALYEDGDIQYLAMLTSEDIPQHVPSVKVDLAALKAAAEAGGVLHGVPEIADFQAGAAAGLSDDVLQTMADKLPLGIVRQAQPGAGPTIASIIKAYTARKKVQEATGAGEVATAEKAFGSALLKEEVREDGSVFFVPSAGQKLLTVLNVMQPAVLEADIPILPLNNLGGVLKLIGAETVGGMLAEARIPTPSGRETMLASGAYDEWLAEWGLLGSRADRRRKDVKSNYLGRLIADMAMPEYQSFGVQEDLRAQGVKPGSTADAAAGLADVGGDWLLPYEEILLGPLGEVLSGAARAGTGWRISRHLGRSSRQSAKVAAAAAAPRLFGNAADSVSAIDGALRIAVLDGVKRGETLFTLGKGETRVEGSLPTEVQRAVRNLLEGAGVNADQAFRKVNDVAAAHRARNVATVKEWMARGTPFEQELRATPEWIAVKKGMEDAGLTPQDVDAGMALSEWMSAHAVAEGDFSSPRDWFAAQTVVAGGEPAPGAFLDSGVLPTAPRAPGARAEGPSAFSDSLRSDVARKGAPLTVRETLQHAAAHGEDEVSAMARRLLDMDHPALASAHLDLDVDLGVGEHGIYDIGANRIGLSRTAGPSTIVHEAAHAVTAHAVRNVDTLSPAGQAAVRSLQNVFEKAQASAPLREAGEGLGLDTLDEFIAEAYSNPKFQAGLRGLQVAPGKSAWRTFVDAVAVFLGLRGRDVDALEHVLSQVDLVAAERLGGSGSGAEGGAAFYSRASGPPIKDPPPPEQPRVVPDRRPEDVWADVRGSIGWWMDLPDTEIALSNLAEEHVILFARDGRQLARFGPEDTRLLEPPVDPARACVLYPRALDDMVTDGEAVYTHNHPSGNAFSTDDFLIAARGNAAELRAVAVGKGFTWVARRPSGGWPDAPHLRRSIDIAHDAAQRTARREMDRQIIAAGGDPLSGTSAAGYSDDLWKSIFGEHYAKTLKKALEIFDISLEREAHRGDVGLDSGVREGATAAAGAGPAPAYPPVKVGEQGRLFSRAAPARAAEYRGVEGKPRTATLFSGGGLIEAGLRKYIDPVFAVEANPEIGAAYRAAHGNHVRIDDVRNVDFEDAGDVDYLHASPVCKNFSAAKAVAESGEQPLDIETARATAEAIRRTQPAVFTLENVRGYQGTEAMAVVEDALRESGYTFDARVYDAADYGAATSRKRLLLRAVKDGELPPVPAPTHGPGRAQPYADWYAAVEDLLEGLPDDQVPPWMRRRLEAAGVDPDAPSKPTLVMGGSAGKNVPYAEAGGPAPTFKATPGEAHRILLPDGRVKRVTPRAVARITGLPDDYPLPAKTATATTILGNGVPPALSEAVFAPLLAGDRVPGSAPESAPGVLYSRSPGNQTDTPAFRAFIEGTKVVDESGAPRRLYHGTTHEFDSFDADRGYVGNHHGRGIYLTTAAGDVGENYATREGPDLKARIEMQKESLVDVWDDPTAAQGLVEDWAAAHPDRAEEVAPLVRALNRPFERHFVVRAAQDWSGRNPDSALVHEITKWAAEKEIAGSHGGAVLPVYAAIKNPLDLRPGRETRFDVEVQWSPDGEEVVGETGPGMDVVNTILAMAESSDTADRIIGSLGDISDGFTATDLERAVRDNPDEFFDGDSSPGQFLQDLYRNLGFDGIVIDAYKTFGPRRTPWGGTTQGMAGLTPGAEHWIAFDPGQVKSATGNVGTFNPKDKRLMYSRAPIVLRNSGERAGVEGLDQVSVPGKLYRGMTEAEYLATVAKNGHVWSRQDYSVSGEGTSFSDSFSDAESYVDFGRDDPRTTGRPNYIVEVDRGDMSPSTDGYYKARGPVPFGRVWKVVAEGDALIGQPLYSRAPDGAPRGSIERAPPTYHEGKVRNPAYAKWAKEQRALALAAAQKERAEVAAWWAAQSPGATVPADPAAIKALLAEKIKAHDFEYDPFDPEAGFRAQAEIGRIHTLLGALPEPEARALFDAAAPLRPDGTSYWEGYRPTGPRIDNAARPPTTFREARAWWAANGNGDPAGAPHPSSDLVAQTAELQARTAARPPSTAPGQVRDAARYIIRYFKTADTQTLLHENAHLIRFLLGDDWMEDLSKFFDHEIDAKTKAPRLTRAGEEQFATALARVLRGQLQPHGRLRAHLEDLRDALGDIWLNLRRKPLALPPGFRDWWDAQLDPAKGLRTLVEVSDSRVGRGPLEIGVTANPQTGRPANVLDFLKEEKTKRANSLAEYLNVSLTPGQKRHALGILGSDTSVEALDVVAKALAHIGTTRARRQPGFGGRLALIGTRSAVPEGRKDEVLRRARAALEDAIGGPVKAGLSFTPDQARGLAAHIDHLVDAGWREQLPEDLLSASRDLSKLTEEEWEAIANATIDDLAGVGGYRDNKAESVAGNAATAFVSMAVEALSSIDQFKALRTALATRFDTTFEVSKNINPAAGAVVERWRRKMSDAAAQVARLREYARDNTFGEHAEVLIRKIAALLPEVGVPAGQVENLLQLNKALVAGSPTAADFIKVRDDLRSLFHDAPAKSRRQRTAEADALARIMRLTDTSDLEAADVVASLGVIQTGLERRLTSVRDTGLRIEQRMSGRADLAMNTGDHDAAAFVYKRWFEGDWLGVAEIAGVRGQTTDPGVAGAKRGPVFDPVAGALAVVTGLIGDSVLAEAAEDMMKIGIPIHTDNVNFGGRDFTEWIPLGSTALTQKEYRDQVLKYMNAILSFEGVDQIQFDSAGNYLKRQYLPAQLGKDGRVDVAAWGDACRILDAWGIKSNTSEMTAMVLPTGEEIFLPKDIKTELDGLFDRTAKAGLVWTQSAEGKPDQILGRLGRFVDGQAYPNNDLDYRGKGGLADKVSRATRAVLALPSRTIAMARVGVTTGVIIPNPAFYIGNGFGGALQALQSKGLVGTLRMMGRYLPVVGGDSGKVLREVFCRVWGESSGYFSQGGASFVAKNGVVYSSDRVVKSIISEGLHTSQARAESAVRIIDDLRNHEGTFWTRVKRDRFLDGSVGTAESTVRTGVSTTARYWQGLLGNVSTAVDDLFRVAAYVDELAGGAAPEEAAKIARRTSFDYGDLTDFEKTTLRRFIMFYTYQRRNADLFWWTMLNHPSRIMGQLRAVRDAQELVFGDDNTAEMIMPEYLDGRLVLDINKAVGDAEGLKGSLGVATVLPPLPAADHLALWVDIFHALNSSEPAAGREMLAKLAPEYQAFFVLGLNYDIFAGRDLAAFNTVPAWMVEMDRQLNGGVVVDDLFKVRKTQNRDPARDEAPGQDRWEPTGDGAKWWWVFRNLVQVPPFGRGADTITQMARGDWFVGGAVEGARWYRESQGLTGTLRDDVVDPFIRAVVRPGLDLLPRVNPSETPVYEAASPKDKVIYPRAGFTEEEELAQLLGIKQVLLPTRAAAEDAQESDRRRRIAAAQAEEDRRDPYKQGR